MVGGRGHLAVIGFLILAALNVGAFARVEQNTHAVEDARVERVRQINKVNVAQCASLRNLYGVIRKTLRDGDEAIDNIQYYRDHPEERAEAHRRNRETIARFRTPPCPPNVEIPP